MRLSSCCLIVAIGSLVTSFGDQASAQGTAAEPLAAPAAAGATSAEDMGYAMGYRIGQQIAAEQREIGSPVDQPALAAGLADAVSGKQARLTEAAFRAAMAGLETAMRQKQRSSASARLVP